MTWPQPKALHLAALIALLLLLVAGCGEASGGPRQSPEAQQTGTVRGAIVDVSARSLLELDTLTVEDASKMRWTLEARGKVFQGFTPSHLREHMLLGLPVTVKYHREGDALVIDEISD